MKIGIASDHHGIEEKTKLINLINQLGHEGIDYGPNNGESVDYPEYAFKVGNAIKNNEIDYGILMCGTGIGMSIAANKVNGVRCARICTIKDALLAKEHNDANIIAFSASIPLYKMKKIVKKYIDTLPSTEERHIKRVNMINDYHD